ncbi:hypothetical protein [Pseudomonas moraviensis]|uniref:Uncharacterized protein n=1 Tax=Pseudomonas moraviensis R28-S TaxID=1395516 RepID=V8R3W0_9PSED|nr:hypothetical protein [Pseudomonas moraviensis]ETF06811.1 hypothetical protein PMO01_18345 [Pseudomonas moraviensis R28-S]
MKIKEINESSLIESYLQDRYRKTAESIKQELGQIDIPDVTYETALELGSIFMFQFGRTNKEEFSQFINEKQIEFTDNKLSAYFNVLLRRKVEVNIDFERLVQKTIANYDVAKEQAAKFLNEIGIPSPFINTFMKNAETIRDLAEVLACDYFYHNGIKPRQDIFDGKHLYTIFKELGEDYKNINIGFADNHKWRYENNILILPKKGYMQYMGQYADLINSYGSGYELSTLMRDNSFYKKVENSFNNDYSPANYHDYKVRADEFSKDLEVYENRKESKATDERMKEYFKMLKRNNIN